MTTTQFSTTHTPDLAAAAGYVVQGTHYPTLTSLSRAYGVKVTTLSRRLRSQHWTLEQAVGLASPPQSSASQGKPISVGGTTYPSMAAACAAHGVKVEVYHARRRTGWSIDEALGRVARPAVPRPGARLWTVAGRSYLSLRKACDAHGLNADRVRSRLSMGWSLEEAFDLAPRTAPPAVPAELRRGDTGTLVICGQRYVWKALEGSIDADTAALRLVETYRAARMDG